MISNPVAPTLGRAYQTVQIGFPQKVSATLMGVCWPITLYLSPFGQHGFVILKSLSKRLAQVITLNISRDL